MTRLKGMTLAQFNGLVDDMRKVYPFKDEQAKIIDTHDLCACLNCTHTMKIPALMCVCPRG